MWLRGRCGLESHSTVVIAPQVISPLLRRGRERLRKFKPPSLGEAGEGSSSRLSPPWERSGEVMQVSTPLPWGGVGGGFLLFSFTNAFAGRGVLRNKSIAVGNTRVLSLFATHWLWGCYEKQGKIQCKIMAKSVAICVILACVLLHFARWNECNCRVIQYKLHRFFMWFCIVFQDKSTYKIWKTEKWSDSVINQRLKKALESSVKPTVYGLYAKQWQRSVSYS